MGNRLARKLLLVGWDAADWRIIRPLMSAGRLPHLKKLIDDGASGTLASPPPLICPVLWTSVATGKRAHRHGIVGDAEPRPDGVGVRAPASTSRTGKAVWNILSQNGLRTHCINWSASHPPEPINGVCVSNRFALLPAGPGRPWRPADKAVHPFDIAEALGALRVRPEELDPQALRAFVPEASAIDQETDKRLLACAMVIARASNVHAAATWAIENRPWDFAAVLYDGIELFCRQFMQYHPGEREEAATHQDQIYRHVVSAAYLFHDMMLGRLLQLAGDQTTVLLVSDHGYQRSDRPAEGAEPEHRPQGIRAMCGPYAKRGAEVIGASLLDVTPTVLSMFGIASGLDMQGRPWTETIDAGATEVETDRVISWDAIAGEAGLHPPDAKDEGRKSREAIEHLLELGYSVPRDQRAEQAVGRTREQNQYNLARSLADAGETARAVALLEPLVRASPSKLAWGQSLLRAYLTLGMNAKARELVELAVDHGAPAALAEVARGAIELAERRPAIALEHLHRARAADAGVSGLHVLIGQGYRRLRCWKESEQAFRHALELDADDAIAWHGLATTALAQEEIEEAAELALRAIDLRPDYAEAHYHLGIALAALGKPHEAAIALKRCLTLGADMLAAYRALAELYDGPLRDPDAARAARRDAHAVILQRRSSRPIRTDDAVRMPPKRSLS